MKSQNAKAMLSTFFVLGSLFFFDLFCSSDAPVFRTPADNVSVNFGESFRARCVVLILLYPMIEIVQMMYLENRYFAVAEGHVAESL